MYWPDFYKGRKVLVTGHTGFKGGWLCRMLVAAGAEVTGYALEPPEGISLFELAKVAEDVKTIYGDIRDLSALREAFRASRPEIVIHLAAQPIVRRSYKEPAYTYEVNVMGTVNVLECVRTFDSVRSVVNVTTDKVYKNREWCWGYRENEELNGYDPYSNSKSCSELVTSTYKAAFLDARGVAVSTVRAGNVIGGGDFAADRIIPDCVRAVATAQDIIVRNPHSVRPYEHVLDPVAVYLMLAADQYENQGIAGSYNVGPEDSDCLMTGRLVELFCEKWEKQTGLKPNWIVEDDGGPHEANFLKLDCSKLKNIFTWKPICNIEKSMEMLVEWYDCYLKGIDVRECMDQQIGMFMEKQR